MKKQKSLYLYPKEFFCGLLIISLTLLLTSKCSLTEGNYTTLLLSPDKTYLYIWGCVANCLFCFLLYQFSILCHKPQKQVCILLILCLPLSLFFVFDPQSHPIQSSIHLILAYLYFFGVNISFLASLIHLSYRNLQKVNHLGKWYGFICIILSFLFMYYMCVVTIFETFFTCSMTCLLLYSIHYLRK